MVAMFASASWSSNARADDEATEFGIARTRYEQGKLDVAATLFRTLLDPAAPPCTTTSTTGSCSLRDPELIERSRAFYAASLLASANKESAATAREQILQIYLNNPAYQPNPAMFSAEVVDEFTRVRGDHKDEIDAVAKRKADADTSRGGAAISAAKDAYIKQLEAIASRETVVDQPSRWVAVLPFGVGQFQNGEPGLGAAFLATEVVLAGASIVTAAVTTSLANTQITATVDQAQLVEKRDAWLAANRVSFGAWAVVAALGIVQAQVAFVPERATTRRRPLPPKASRPTAVPAVSWAPGAATAGVVGRF